MAIEQPVKAEWLAKLGCHRVLSIHFHPLQQRCTTAAGWGAFRSVLQPRNFVLAFNFTRHVEVDTETTPPA